MPAVSAHGGRFLAAVSCLRLPLLAPAVPIALSVFFDFYRCCDRVD